tara:strand:+ start:869 stop:1213 length:345 start_codon:yes stop_codon:yes gene_type:complete
MKPNKLEECKKGASAWSGVEVPTEINETEARFFHILLIEDVHRPSLKKYDVRSSIIKMNQNDYITKIGGKGKKGTKAPNYLALLGYTNLFVLHDPLYIAPKKKVAKKVEPKKEI